MEFSFLDVSFQLKKAFLIKKKRKSNGYVCLYLTTRAILLAIFIRHLCTHTKIDKRKKSKHVLYKYFLKQIYSLKIATIIKALFKIFSLKCVFTKQRQLSIFKTIFSILFMHFLSETETVFQSLHERQVDKIDHSRIIFYQWSRIFISLV